MDNREDNGTPLIFGCSYIRGDEIWFSARDFNGFFRGNLKTGDLEFIDFFPDEPLRREELHRAIIEKDSKLFFVPQSGCCIHVYDMKKNKMFSYPLGIGGGWKYSSAYKFGDAVYFIPQKAKKILKYSCTDNKLTPLKQEKTNNFKVMHISTAAIEPCVYFTEKKRNVIIQFNMQDETHRCFEVGNSNDRYSVLAQKNGILYLKIEEQPEVVLWDPKVQKITARHIVKTKLSFNMLQHRDLVLGNSWTGDGIQTFDIRKMTGTSYNRECEKYLSRLEILDSFVYNDELYYLWSGDGRIYNSAKHTCLAEFKLSAGVDAAMKKKLMEQNTRGVFEETGFFSVIDYMENLKRL